MTERKVETETPSTTSGSELIREVDPNSPEHKDAGQAYIEEHGGEPNQGRDEAERMAEEREKEERER